MRAEPLPLVGGAYTDDARPWSMQDTCNYLPTSAERNGTRSPDKLKTPPGLRPFVEVITEVAPGIEEYTPVRGVHEAEGRLFAVIGETLYRISSAGVAIPLGTVPGRGRVSMEHNQISLGNQLTVVNGSAGYVYNTVTDTFQRIDDPGFPGSLISLFIDGYIIGIEPQGRFAFNSSPADALNYNTLDRFTSEVRPDKLISGAVSNNELVLFSASSGEFFQNTGASEQPFRTKRITMDKGAAGAYVVATADNTVSWLGNDGVFYQLDGYTPRRISFRPIEQAIRGLNWSEAFAFVWEDEGHTVIYWTFPDGQTWGYDASEREWHRRESYGLDRWRVTGMAYWNNRWIAGDFQKGRLWYVDWEYPWEGDQEFISSRTLGVIHDNQSRMLHSRLELVMDTGMPYVDTEAFPAQPDPPTISGDAPEGFVGAEYSFTYTLADGTPPYAVTLRTGALPTGVTLSSAGVLSGTPTATGTYEWTVRVTDSTGLYDDLADSSVVSNALWFAGPVLEDGPLGGSPLFYAKSGTVDGLATATPIALPAEGDGVIERMSVAGGKVFMHRSTTACVSSDNGGTWEACDNSLFANGWQRDVFWNGTNFYYDDLVSADGLVWTAIPNLPATAQVQMARDSDGMVVAQSSDGVFHTTIDNGANWVTALDAGVSIVPPIATDGTDYVFVSSSNLHYFSNDDLATAGNPVVQNDNTFGSFYANGAWFAIKFMSGDGITAAYGVLRATAADVWPNGSLTAGFAFIQDGVDLATERMAFDGAGTCVAWEQDGGNCNLYSSADNGVTWASAGTVYGNAVSIVHAPEIAP